MNFHSLIAAALAEDIGSGDVTTPALVPERATARMRLAARGSLVMAAGGVAIQVFHALDAAIEAKILVKDGEGAEAGQALISLEGSARALMTGERTALNLLQRACGVATLTREYVEAVSGTGAKILDTRKTMPGLRALDKYAVKCGGGVNHRMGLYDAVMIKDNHIAFGLEAWGLGLGGLVEKARASSPRPQASSPRPQASSLPIIIECDTLPQVQEALAAEPDRILLDNMTPEQLRAAVALVQGRVPLEASGGITLQNVREVAETGVDFISVGALTHSAPAADIGADVEMDSARKI